MVVSDAIVSIISVWTLIVDTYFYLITCRHLVTANDQETSVRCRLTDLLILDLEEYFYTAFTAGENVFMETVGPTSKCVDFEIMTNWEYNSTSIPPIYGGACYEVCVRVCVCTSSCASCACYGQWKLHTLQVSCASEGEVAITVGQTEILCQSAGQQVSSYKREEAPLNGTVFA